MAKKEVVVEQELNDEQLEAVAGGVGASVPGVRSLASLAQKPGSVRLPDDPLDMPDDPFGKSRA
jgi:hypothetical protein